ncbi:hypothetical protein [Nitratidesulfovibrio liaohensis]|uniref:hypothetical protein n=1 Tax=Nitratidesulfovibrio liaohensis TaxID=2604158 RepID=UPI00141DD83B|nr:hypothetical protein [Nitratidesulfovibrio liaohensis]NHZ46368.1 hypothetical protein [Nitratidesulfovibrio liaohensis]
MKIIGLRFSPDSFRYAVLEKNDGIINFTNANNETKVCKPADLDNIDDICAWIYDEIKRIITINNDVSNIVIKTNEYSTDTKSKRTTIYLEGVATVASKLEGKPVTFKLYSQIGVSSSNVKDRMESRYGKTKKYWDSKIADAVAAAAASF